MTLMETYGLADVWHFRHPDVKESTWHRPNQAQASQLDMFWICSFLLPFVQMVGILPFFCSAIFMSILSQPRFYVYFCQPRFIGVEGSGSSFYSS